MSVEPGSRIGPYEIQSPLGAGGMGAVFRARDTRLLRDVAVKALPDVFANDPDRLARLQREAQILASLNHPHVASIYGLEESDATRVLILELVEGPRSRSVCGGWRGLHARTAKWIADDLFDQRTAVHCRRREWRQLLR